MKKIIFISVLLLVFNTQFFGQNVEVDSVEIQNTIDSNDSIQLAKITYKCGGNYEDVIKKWKETIEKETDPERQARYYFKIASTQGRKLQQYSEARENVLIAAQLKPNWGFPYLLIGDLYAKTSLKCGDKWNQRLAVLAAIEKWNYAKSIDPSFTDKVNLRIEKYKSFKKLPQQEWEKIGFQEEDKVVVGCWIKETVTLKFK